MNSVKSPLRRLALAVLLLSGVSVASAAVIVWDTPVTISADTDVSTAGTFLQAFNLGDDTTSTVINGVTFAAGPTPNLTGILTAGSGAGSLTMKSSDGAAIKQTAAYSSTASPSPFASLSTNYKTLLKSADYVYPGSTSGTASINTLTIGQQYQVQFWLNDSRINGAGRNQTFTATNAVTADSNSTELSGGVGQFITGTFTADAATQIISIAGSAYQLNAYQIRVIPEPATWALLLGSASLMVGLTKRRRA